MGSSGGNGAGGWCQWFWWGTVDDKVGEDDGRDAKESSPQPGRRVIEGKVSSRSETGRKETGRSETGRKETRGKKWEGRQMDRRKGECGETVAKEPEGVGDDS